jgi:hypothetical protein
MSEEGVIVINGSSTSRSRSTSPTKNSGEPERPRRFLNGWSKEQERLMEEWSDIAKCYRWLHDNSQKFYYSKTLWINLPVIILTTLGGTANFGLQSMFSDTASRTYASFSIGAVSLFAGLLTTIGNYLRFPQLEESHRGAAITWGKFQRMIAVELAMNPNDRMDSLDFLKICRADLDRLIEQSPPIPKEAIKSFEEKFGETPKLKKPDICGSLEHTHVFESSDVRIKQMAVEGALLLKHKKRTLNELLSTQVQDTIKQQVELQITDAIEKNRKKLEEDIEMERVEVQNAQEEFNKIAEERRKKITDEIELEKSVISRSSRRSSSVDFGLDKVTNKQVNITYGKYSNTNGQINTVMNHKLPINKIMTRLPSIKISQLHDVQSPRIPLSTMSFVSDKSDKSDKSNKLKKGTVVIMPDPKQPETKEPDPEDLKRSIEIMIER